MSRIFLFLRDPWRIFVAELPAGGINILAAGLPERNMNVVLGEIIPETKNIELIGRLDAEPLDSIGGDKINLTV